MVVSLRESSPGLVQEALGRREHFLVYRPLEAPFDLTMEALHLIDRSPDVVSEPLFFLRRQV